MIPLPQILIRTLPGERFTPFALAQKLRATAILESASFTHGKARYSILLIDEAFRVTQEADTDTVAITIDGEKKSAESSDILEVLDTIAREHRKGETDFPLPASGIGYLGYDYAQRCDTIHIASRTDTIGVPESQFIVGHTYIVFDHFTDTIHICGMNYTLRAIDLEKAIDEIERRINSLDFSYLETPAPPLLSTIITDEKSSHDDFIEGVKEIKEHIVKGNLLQAVLSRRLEIASEESAISVYRRLRSTNPSPYLFYIDFGGFQMIGASPESIVKVKHAEASIRPIAGTRRRGKDAAEDVVLSEDLLSDPKEKSEHLMLVDLARNDLGRVCRPGTVEVTRYMDIEMFSHVIHIVSDVIGTLDTEKYRPINVLKSSFPAGTVSGAPKIEAIERISRIEKLDRSFYAGAVGYLEADGDLDFCISIRCALKKDSIWFLQAGAGIVQDSVPENEWRETGQKLGALHAILAGGAV